MIVLCLGCGLGCISQGLMCWSLSGMWYGPSKGRAQWEVIPARGHFPPKELVYSYITVVIKEQALSQSNSLSSPMTTYMHDSIMMSSTIDGGPQRGRDSLGFHPVKLGVKAYSLASAIPFW